MKINGHDINPGRLVRAAIGVFLLAYVAPFVAHNTVDRTLFASIGLILIDHKLFFILRGKRNGQAVTQTRNADPDRHTE